MGCSFQGRTDNKGQTGGAQTIHAVPKPRDDRVSNTQKHKLLYFHSHPLSAFPLPNWPQGLEELGGVHEFQNDREEAETTAGDRVAPGYAKGAQAAQSSHKLLEELRPLARSLLGAHPAEFS